MLWLFAALAPLRASSADELRELYKQKQYVDLRDRLTEFQKDKTAEIFFYRGAAANKFNMPAASLKFLSEYLKKAPPKDALLKDCYELLADNYIKTYKYAQAAETYAKLLQEFSASLAAKEKAAYENSAKLWAGLRQVPPQRVVFKGDFTIQGVKEKVGLTVPVEIGGHKSFFIFDTGANLSVATESLSQKLGLNVIDTAIDVTSITGEKIKARLGVAERLKLGGLEAQNVVFIIFPDAALYIEPIRFQINGILGFPLIEALREITWTRGKQLIISPASRRQAPPNLAIDGLTLLIAGNRQGQRLTFSLDTGANNSSFYPPFFKAFASEITAEGEPFTQKISGVGGAKDIKAYRMKNLRLNFAGKEANFAQAEILLEETTASSRYLYGNIGRDLLDQYEKMTLNFEKMFIVFS